MENDDAAQQPVAEEATQAVEPQEAEQPTQAEEIQEPSQEEEAEQQPQDSNEGADAPEPTDEELPQDEEFDPLSNYPLNVQGQQDIPVGEDGSIDPVAFARQIQEQTLAQVRFEQKESRDWQAIDKKYGDQLTPTRRQMILNARVANAVEGRQADLKKVADSIMKEFGVSRSQGRAEAGVSRKVQKAASLETATANRGPERGDDLMDRIANGDKSAATALFDKWQARGDI